MPRPARVDPPPVPSAFLRSPARPPAAVAPVPADAGPIARDLRRAPGAPLVELADGRRLAVHVFTATGVPRGDYVTERMLVSTFYTLAALPPPYGTAENLEETTARFAFNNPADLANFALGDRLVLELIVAQNDDALWLPPAAVRDFQGRNFVVIQEGDTQRRVDVQLGIEGDGRTEILEGVTEGDTVVGP